MKTVLLGYASGIVIVLVAIGLYFELGMARAAANEYPGRIETWVMRKAVGASVRRGARGLQNPLPHDDATVIAGGKLYINGCAGCHGDLGGPAWTSGPDAFPPKPQLPRVGTRYEEPELYWIFKHGLQGTGMPANAPFYSETQLWQLATFARQIDHLSAGASTELERYQREGH